MHMQYTQTRLNINQWPIPHVWLLLKAIHGEPFLMEVSTMLCKCTYCVFILCSCSHRLICIQVLDIHGFDPCIKNPTLLKSTQKDKQSWQLTTVTKRHCHQCCQNFRAPNRGKLDFLPAARDFKVAQYLSRNYAPNFPNLGAFKQ